MDTIRDLFDYVFVDNSVEKTLFLLHGTGGDKDDFLFLNDALELKYNLVGLNGNVDEHGMRRFFKRLSPGVFDMQSIREETEKLQLFFANWIKEYHLERNNLYALGYSNGANILLSLMFLHPNFLENYVLLHPMLPFTPATGSVVLHATTIYLTMGELDSMVSDAEQRALLQTLESFRPQLTVARYDLGHEIHTQEIQDLVLFLQ